MNYAFLFPVAVCGLLVARPAAAQTTPATANQAPVPVQMNCRSFSGHAKSTTGTPLVGATVMVKGTYVARTTNDEGYFTFDLPAVPTTAPRLMISSAGYAPQDFLITGCAPLEIELQILEGTRIKQRGKHKGFIKKVGQE
ncbi:MAG: hypothetical protein EOO59_08965 [Hymenobacter sp.]|nr:MAG: hypothetical protein EOO59_08965 [Hymenobacter sp.]